MAVWRGQRGADFGLALAQVEVKLWYFLNWLEGENRRALAKADLCDNYLVIWNASSPHYRRALGALKGERSWRMQVGEAGP
jgi:hypothetical protein